MSMLRVMLLGLALALGAGSAPVLGAQDTRPNAAAANRAIAELRSPYCPGLMLEVCPSPEAAALRDSIRDLAAEGMSSSAIVEWMISRHGEEWRAVPKRSGLGVWAWILPPVFLLVGLGLIAARLRMAREEAPIPQPEAETTLSSEEQERLALAMREWEAEGEVE